MFESARGEASSKSGRGRSTALFSATLFATALVAGILMTPIGSPVMAADLSDAQELFDAGKYGEAEEMATAEIERNVYLEQWRHLKVEAQLAQGLYDAARDSVEEAIDRYPSSIQLYALAHEAHLYNDQAMRAEIDYAMIERYLRDEPRRYSSPANKVVLGRYFFARGADARQVLELFYDPVIDQFPDFAEAYLASAELALAKNDNALAAEVLGSAPAEARATPRYHYLTAMAFHRDDPKKMAESLEKALEINPRHIDSLLLQVDKLIDSEQYDEAGQAVDDALQVNPKHPLAWAYKAVLANLANQPEAERSARAEALATWTTNPEVDHTIGRKLSQKYRFREGASYQRRSLQFAPGYTPARMQLAQDLLRLGEEEEGWSLAEGVQKEDAYNVAAHNLVTLRDEIKDYRILGDESLRVRMEQREASLYGERVLKVLRRTKQTLSEKYDVEIEEPVVVEIFPEQKDFAVRTFGMPGVSGYLGVCFGNVITANSPAAVRSPANWEAVVWHEFCHVVTLHKSKNKMPRWLSEGISVYEEKQENPSWGQSMTPEYRRMILGGEMTPVSELSSAFLAPPTPMHLQFAYYESSLVVEYLVEQYGLETIRQILNDLGDGMAMNESLIRHVAPLGKLDTEFAQFAIERAETLAPELNWDELDLPPDAESDAVAQWLEDHPDNFSALVRLSVALIQEEKWEEALQPAGRLLELFPDYIEAGNAYELMARAHRGLGDEQAEREALEELSARSADSVDAYDRLMELAAAREDWEALERNAQRMLAVNPLVPAPHRFLSQAAENLGRPEEAIDSYRALLEFDTSDPANAHYRLATLLAGEGERDAAKRHTLMALEEAPRYREAHKLLLELSEEAEQQASPDDSQPTETSDASAPTSEDPTLEE